MHEGKLPRVIELEAWDALSGSGDGWLRKPSQLAGESGEISAVAAE
jgi:hypothetical protein